MPIKNRWTIKKILLGCLTFLGLFLVFSPVLAQVNTGIEFGAYTGLVNTDIRIIAAKIIRAALGLLGIVALVLILWGGFMYMTAEGDETKLAKAKQIIKNAAIGLAIMLSAFAITQFVLSKLTEAIGNNYCAQNPADPSCKPIVPSGCVDPLNCQNVRSFFASIVTTGKLSLYKVVVKVNFYGGLGDKAVKQSTITSNNFKVQKVLADGSLDSIYSGTFEFKSPSSVAFHPIGSCGADNPNTDCFEKDTTYRITLSSLILSDGDEKTLDCSGASCEATFTTGNLDDSIAPNVELTLPGNGSLVGANPHNNTIKANYSDDSGVDTVKFRSQKNNLWSDISPTFSIVGGERAGARSNGIWQPILSDPEKAEFLDLAALAWDLDNHLTTSTWQRVKVLPFYCFNGTLDTNKGEEKVGVPPTVMPDCGINSQCGACTGERCTTNFDCAGGYCDQTTYTCVERPKILDVTPLIAGPGSYVTVRGYGFGNTAPTAALEGFWFLGAAGIGDDVKAEVVACPLIAGSPLSWKSNYVIVKVPDGVANGPMEIRKIGYTTAQSDKKFTFFDITDDTDWGLKTDFTNNNQIKPGLSCVSPEEGQSLSEINVAGINLGGTKGVLKFGDFSGLTNAWTSSLISGAVPTLPAQDLSLKAIVAGQDTNPLPFRILPISERLLPQIDYIDPVDGPVGAYVTIFGKNFGSSGVVKFLRTANDTAPLTADLPPSYCSNTWTPTQIIIKAPVAIADEMTGISKKDYLVRVTATISSQSVDSNTKKFEVNKNILKPGLCSIEPDNGPTGLPVILKGEDFGVWDAFVQDPQWAVEYWKNVTSTGNFVSPRSWVDREIKDKVPSMEGGGKAAVSGKVKIWSANMVYSNALNFKVQNCKEELKKGGRLEVVCPTADGDAVQKCCDSGSCGTTCEENTPRFSVFAWHFSTGKLPIIPKVLERCGNFCVDEQTKACAPDGNGKDTKVCPSSNQACGPLTPSPAPALMWPGGLSICVNAVVKVVFNTDVNDNGATLINGATSLTTPDSSSVNVDDIVFIYKCDSTKPDCPVDDSSRIVSGTYNFSADSGNGKGIIIGFTPTPDSETKGFAAGTTYRVIVTTAAKSTASGLEANMPANLNCPAIPAAGSGKTAAYCFSFKTSDSANFCRLGAAVIDPITYTTSTFNKTARNFYNVSALAAGNNPCLTINANDYDWRWNATDDEIIKNKTLLNVLSSIYYSVSNKDDFPLDTRTDAKDQNLEIKNKATTNAQEVTSTWLDDPTADFSKKIHGRAFLNIIPESPKVIEYWPNCNSACINAEIGVKFNVLVKLLENGQNEELIKDSFRLYKCTSKDCTYFVSRNFTIEPQEPQIINGDEYAKEIKIKPDDNLESNTLYKVGVVSYAPLSGSLQSEGGAFMDENDKTNKEDGTGKEDGFYWKFRTKNNDNVCAIDTITMDPASATVDVVGAKAHYSAVPRGTPDECSADGQRLAASAYNWLWSSENTNVATVSRLDMGKRLLGSKKLTEYCGNSAVDTNESCDSTIDADCGIDCSSSSNGTLPCSATLKVQCCGNGGAPEFSEECDDGLLNGTLGSSCSAKCLKKPAAISLNYCISKNTLITDTYKRLIDCQNKWGAVSLCGNGGALESGEECDAGSQNGVKDGTGIIQSGCTSECLSTAKNFGTGTGQCGNKTIDDGIGGTTNNNEQCDGELGCGTDCRWEFKGDNKIDPLQYATAVGKVAPDSNNQQKTQILAKAPAPVSTATKIGTADFILQCGFKPVDANCPDSNPMPAYGVGKNFCCYPRPTVYHFAPPISSNVCPNALLKIIFDQEMDESSFASSTAIGQSNIILAKAASSATCAPGTWQVSKEEIIPSGWWQKIKAFARRIFGRQAEAQIFCAGETQYSLTFATTTISIDGVAESRVVTQAAIKLTNSLDLSTDYRIIVEPFIKSSYGVSINLVANSRKDFKTSAALCKITDLSLTPETYLFQRPNESKEFQVRPNFTNPAVLNGPSQELTPLSGVYDWDYNWVDGDSAALNLITINPLSGLIFSHSSDPNAPDPKINTVSSILTNGDTSLGAHAHIIADESSASTVGKVFSATSTIQIFICENPWPTVSGYLAGFEDKDGSTSQVVNPPGSSAGNLQIGRGWTNFRILYCRDAGKTNDTTDDLSAFRTPAVLYHQPAFADPILKEFFFTFDNADNKDSVGLRVYPNLDHKPLMEWYNSQPWIPKGAPTPVKVGNSERSYEALQEGRTYYINGINSDESPKKLYSNVWVFSFSDNPTKETVNIVNQIINNFALNINLAATQKELVAEFYRDFTRLQDLDKISGKLVAFYNKEGKLPALTDNPGFATFIPAYTNSKWLSWQAVLGKSLGVALPVDPINKFVGCGNDIPPGLISWWKADGDPKDIVGSNDGELKNGATFEQGKIGQAFKFDGIDDYVSIPDADALKITGNITIGAWIKHNKTLLKIVEDTIMKGTDSYGLRATKDGGFDFHLYADNWRDLRADVSVNAEQWYYIVGTYDYDKGEQKIYVDGILKKTSSWKYLINSNSDPLTFGKKVTANNNWFSGSLDDVQLYNRALSNSEISALYEGSLEKYDPDTCWNAANSTFICPVGSHIYQYETQGGVRADLKADFEATDYAWVNPLDDVKLCSETKEVCSTNADCEQDKCLGETGAKKCKFAGASCATDLDCPNNNICLQDLLSYQTMNSCDSVVKGIGGVCGDGIVGAGEDCELGQTKSEDCGSTPYGYPSNRNYSCDNSCKWEVVPVGHCSDSTGNFSVPNICSLDKECSNVTSFGVSYNFCKAFIIDKSSYLSCKPTGKCGDGIKQGTEACDKGDKNGKYGSGCDNLCTLNNTNTCGDNNRQPEEVCDKGGPVYDRDKNLSCSWDCQSYDYCGDGRVSIDLKAGGAPNEECEKNESCQVGTCTGGFQAGKYCEKDADCSGDESVKCENYKQGKKYCRAPNETKYKMFRDSNGFPFFQDATTTATINPSGVLTYDDSSKSCAWERSNVRIPPDSEKFATYMITCLPFTSPPPLPPSPTQFCGVDGNKDGQFLDPGEECDNGLLNGDIPPTPKYNQIATFCGYDCKNKVISGPF